MSTTGFSNAGKLLKTDSIPMDRLKTSTFTTDNLDPKSVVIVEELDARMANVVSSITSSDGTLIVNQTSSAVDLVSPVDTWHFFGDTLDPIAATTLQNSFTSDSTVSSGKFRKENGVVYVEGYLNLPTSFEINAGQTFFIAPIIDQLPLGYRPDSLLVKRVTVQDEASGGSQNWNTPTIVTVNALGILQFQYITTDSNHYIPVTTGTPHKLWFGFSYLAA